MTDRLLDLDATRVWSVVGWTMLHYLWLGLAAGVALWLVRLALRRAGANVRYAYACASLALLTAAPLGIGVYVAENLPDFAVISADEPATENASDTDSEIDLAALEASGAALSEPPRFAAEENPTYIELNEQNTTPPADSFAPLVAPMEAPIETQMATESEEASENDSPLAQQLSWRAVREWLDPVAGYLPWVWLAGAPLTFALLATGLIGAERLRRSGRPLQPGDDAEGQIVAILERLAATLRIRRRVGVGVCGRLRGPILVGVVRPLILLPPAALCGWTPEQVEMVLLHELAHVRRWDNLVNLLQRVVESALFFQPAVWLVSGWIRAEREHCCDALVVAHTRRPQAYAETLAQLAGARFHAPESTAESLARAAGPISAMAQRHLIRRIRHILNKEREPMQVTRKTLLGLVTLLFGALVAAALVGPPVDADESGEVSVNNRVADKEAAVKENDGKERDAEVGGDEESSTESPADELFGALFPAEAADDPKNADETPANESQDTLAQRGQQKPSDSIPDEKDLEALNVIEKTYTKYNKDEVKALELEVRIAEAQVRQQKARIEQFLESSKTGKLPADVVSRAELGLKYLESELAGRKAERERLAKFERTGPGLVFVHGATPAYDMVRSGVLHEERAKDFFNEMERKLAEIKAAREKHPDKVPESAIVDLESTIEILKLLVEWKQLRDNRLPAAVEANAPKTSALDTRDVAKPSSAVDLDLEEAQVRYARAQQTYLLFQSLYKQNAAPPEAIGAAQSEFDLAAVGLKRAERAMEQANMRLEYARKSAAVAEQEYKNAVEANKKAGKNVFGEGELQRLKLEFEKADLEIKKAELETGQMQKQNEPRGSARSWPSNQAPAAPENRPRSQPGAWPAMSQRAPATTYQESDLDLAELDVQEAKLKHEYLKQEYKMKENLHAGAAISSVELLQTKAQLDLNAIALKRAELVLKKLKDEKNRQDEKKQQDDARRRTPLPRAPFPPDARGGSTP